jgi:rhodanese-related sulfurtransferase
MENIIIKRSKFDKSITAAKKLIACSVIFNLIIVYHSNCQNMKNELPKEKQTKLELYVTSKEAYDMWKASPEKIKVLDVRTPEEYIYVGHTAMAYNVPLAIQTYTWDSTKNYFSMKPNPDFLKNISEVFTKTDTILVMCRSGGRSAMAINQLAAAGYKNVYNITDGMEGDTVDDPQNLYAGQRLKNGWKNSGIPWTYKVDPKKMLLPANR